MSISELMLPELEDEASRTRKVLEAVPADQMGFKLRDDFRTIGWNANHLVEIISWTSDILDNAEFDIDPPGGPKYETPSIEDPGELLSLFDKHLAAAKSAIADASDDKMAETWTMKMAGQTLFTLPKGVCLRTWVMNHLVHHRAILSVHLRMAGVESTAVYDG